MANLIKNIIPAATDRLLRKNGYPQPEIWSKGIAIYQSENRRIIIGLTELDFHVDFGNGWEHIATIQLSISLDDFKLALLLHSIGAISIFAFEKNIWKDQN